jgi:hypothetical protein
LLVVEKGVNVPIKSLVKGAPLIVPRTRCSRGRRDDFGPAAIKLDFCHVSMPAIGRSIPEETTFAKVDADFRPPVRWNLGYGMKNPIGRPVYASLEDFEDSPDHPSIVTHPRIKTNFVAIPQPVRRRVRYGGNAKTPAVRARVLSSLTSKRSRKGRDALKGVILAGAKSALFQ